MSKTVTKKKAGSNKYKLISKTAKSEYAHMKALQKEYFGTGGDDKKIRLLAKKVGQGKAPVGKYYTTVKQGGTTKNASVKRAGLTVAAEIVPQLQQSANYREGVKSLYATLAQQQAANQGNINSAVTAAKDDTGKRYDDLSGKVAANFNASKDSSNSELARLGINKGSYSNEQSAASLIQGLAGSGKANALTNMGASGQGYNQLMSLLGGEGAQTGAQYQQAALQKENALKATRPSKIYTLTQQLKDQARAEEADRAQQAFMNNIASQKFGVYQDTSAASAIKDLASARKSVADSKKPKVVRKKITKSPYGP